MNVSMREREKETRRQSCSFFKIAC